MWKYRKVVVHGHPYADKRGCVLFHRLVVEKSIGRYLLPNEHVHHKDGNPYNNDISNLELVSVSEHRHKHSEGVTLLSFNCAVCGKEFIRPKRGKIYKYCSRECLGKGTLVARQEGFRKYMDNIRISPEEKKKRKAARMRAWRASKRALAQW